VSLSPLHRSTYNESSQGGWSWIGRVGEREIKRKKWDREIKKRDYNKKEKKGKGRKKEW
jgi:hypothetical protein